MLTGELTMSWVLSRYKIARLTRDQWTELAKCLGEQTDIVDDRFFRPPCFTALMHYAKVRCISTERLNIFRDAVIRLCGFDPDTVTCWEVVRCG